MTANEIREAIARDKARDGVQDSMYDEKVRDMRIGRDAGIREATEYWLGIFQAIEEIDTSLMTDEEINIGLSGYVDFSNQMKVALGND